MDDADNSKHVKVCAKSKTSISSLILVRLPTFDLTYIYIYIQEGFIIQINIKHQNLSEKVNQNSYWLNHRNVPINNLKKITKIAQDSYKLAKTATMNPNYRDTTVVNSKNVRWIP